jgi:probable phosphoglycerate mutase
MDSRPVIEYFARIEADPLNISVNGGESLLSHKKRVLRYFDWLKKQDYHCILTVAHEETLRVFYAWFNHIPDQQLRELHFDNCALLSYDFN